MSLEGCVRFWREKNKGKGNSKEVFFFFLFSQKLKNRKLQVIQSFRQTEIVEIMKNMVRKIDQNRSYVQFFCYYMWSSKISGRLVGRNCKYIPENPEGQNWDK